MNMLAKCRRGSAVGSVACAVMLGGCDSVHQEQTLLGVSRASYGAYDMKIGDPAPNFSFVVDGKGLSSFEVVRGRASVLVFEKQQEWSNHSRWEALVRAAERMSDVEIPVRVIVVGNPTKTCNEALSAIRTTQIESDRLVIICDTDREISNLYGPNSVGRFYVIGNRGMIVGVGDSESVDEIGKQLASAVGTIAKEDLEWQLLTD